MQMEMSFDVSELLHLDCEKMAVITKYHFQTIWIFYRPFGLLKLV